MKRGLEVKDTARGKAEKCGPPEKISQSTIGKRGRKRPAAKKNSCAKRPDIRTKESENGKEKGWGENGGAQPGCVSQNLRKETPNAKIIKSSRKRKQARKGYFRPHPSRIGRPNLKQKASSSPNNRLKKDGTGNYREKKDCGRVLNRQYAMWDREKKKKDTHEKVRKSLQMWDSALSGELKVKSRAREKNGWG